MGGHKCLSDDDHPVDCSELILGTKECSNGVLDLTDRLRGSILTLEDPKPKAFGSKAWAQAVLSLPLWHYGNHIVC